VPQAPQDGRVCVTLPDHVHMPHGQVDRLAGEHLHGHIHQHPVSQIDRVVQPDKRHRRTVLFAEVLKHPFTAEARLGIFPDRAHGSRLIRSGPVGRAERIDVAGRQCDDPRAAEPHRNPGRQIGVHGPGQGLVAGRAELAGGQVDDIRHLRQRRQGFLIEQIGGNRLDAVGFEPVANGRIGEPRSPNDPRLLTGLVPRPPSQPSHGRSHLAGHTQQHQVALNPRHVLDQRRRRPGHHFLKLDFGFDPFGQFHV